MDKPLKDIDLSILDYTDETRLTFGKYLGDKLKDVPAGYLLWCFDELKNLDPLLKAYIRENMDNLYERKENEEDNEIDWGSW